MEFAVHKNGVAQQLLPVHEGQAVVQEYAPVSSAQQHLSATHSNKEEYYYSYSADIVVYCSEVAAVDHGIGWVVAGKHWDKNVLGQQHQFVLVDGLGKAKVDAVLVKAG